MVWTQLTLLLDLSLPMLKPHQSTLFIDSIHSIQCPNSCPKIVALPLKDFSPTSRPVLHTVSSFQILHVPNSRITIITYLIHPKISIVYLSFKSQLILKSNQSLSLSTNFFILKFTNVLNITIRPPSSKPRDKSLPPEFPCIKLHPILTPSSWSCF